MDRGGPVFMNRDSVAEIRDAPTACEERRGKDDEQETARDCSVQTQLAASQTTDKPALCHSEERKRRGIQVFAAHEKNLDPSLRSG
jgi:hypothetical protein